MLAQSVSPWWMKLDTARKLTPWAIFCMESEPRVDLKLQVWLPTEKLPALFLDVLRLVAQLSPTLCDPMDCSPPGSFVHGILQARTLE